MQERYIDHFDTFCINYFWVSAGNRDHARKPPECFRQNALLQNALLQNALLLKARFFIDADPVFNWKGKKNVHPVTMM